MISFDLSDIFNNLPEEKKLNKQHVDDIASKMGLDLLAGLISATPVDTGVARNGWQMSKNGRSVIVENQVPYIGILNDGTSKQAPAGFIEDEIDRVTRG